VAACDDLPLPDLSRRHAGRERAVDTVALLDVSAGVLACVSLLGRRRWPVGVALVCLLLGTVSSSATPAGLLALSSLAVHRGRPTTGYALSVRERSFDTAEAA
jgi:hypothetical protein